MLLDGRTDRQTDGWTNGRKLARLSRPAKAGATKNTQAQLEHWTVRLQSNGLLTELDAQTGDSAYNF